VVRLFQIYYPVRQLVLVIGEATLVYLSFVIATALVFGPDAYLVLNYEYGFYKVCGITAVILLCSYYFDVYAMQRPAIKGEPYVRLLLALGFVSFVLAGLEYFLPAYMPRHGVLLLGFTIVVFLVFGWRWGFSWLLRRPYFKEQVYVVGSGELTKEIVDSIRSRPELGMDVVRWTGAIDDGNLTREELATSIRSVQQNHVLRRVIIGLPDRRGRMPVRELLALRMNGIKVDDAAVLIEQISGKIEIDGLNPSNIIFSDGFRVSTALLLARRLVSIAVSLVILIVCLPLLPFIVLAIKLSSPGPVVFRQERVGRYGHPFYLYKFRTMFHNAEAETGPTWTTDNDPRITRVGRFLRITRLDEIPQLWNVLKGDMGFVGPRPERPEFVQWLNDLIPYYQLRHIIRPGITGWAQVRYQYGASVEETKQKLKYDLYYIKHMSLVLDLLILFETTRTILAARGK
jgi:sugar transferase (PEP-CTERM system associated)